MKSRLKECIEDSKKTPARRHSIVRGELLEPSEEEVARTQNKRDKRNLLSWYERCNELGVYRMKHNGHCNVPTKDPRLGEVS